MNPSQPTGKLMILMADDDEDDRELVRDVFHDGQLPGELTFVNDGQELIDYLRGKHPHQAPVAPRSSCSTSTCPARTATRRWSRSRPTRNCATSRWSC